MKIEYECFMLKDLAGGNYRVEILYTFITPNVYDTIYIRAVRLTEKFGSSGTSFSTEKFYAKEPVVSVLISRLTPAKRPPDCRLKCSENNKIVLFLHNMHCTKCSNS